MGDGVSMAELPFEKLRRMVEQSTELTAEARADSELSRDYRDGHQLTAAEIAALQRRKQPIVVNNRIARKVDAMIGIEQRSRTDPRAYPRNPSQEEAADIATKALVYVDDQTRFDSLRSECFENMIVEGYGGCEVIVEERNGRFEIVINRLRWEEIFYDPHSREKDFSDATFLGAMKWMDLDQAIELYEDAYDSKGKGDDLETLLRATLGNVQDGETYEDRPIKSGQFRWGDARQERVRVAQMYYKRKGVWYLAVLAGGGEILNQPSPYLDEYGKPTCPIMLMTAYVDRDNRRYGLVKSMRSAQDEINKRRSKLLHMLNTRQTMGVKGAVSARYVKDELAKPDGHIEYDPAFAEQGIRPFEIIQNQDQASGQFQLLVESKDEIDKLGPNASLIGQLQGQQSGRAIMAQQQAGLVELAPIYDSLRDWTLRCYRQMWMRVRQFWTEERWVRITDEVEAAQFVSVNQVVGFGPDGQPIMENAVAEIDVDIIISEAPDYTILRQEQFEQLSDMAQAGIPIPPEMLIEASNLRDKGRILEQMRESQAQAAQAQQQAAERSAMMEQAALEGKLVLQQAQAQRQEAEAQRVSATIPKIQAETGSEQAEATIKALSARRAVLGV
jgi:hypothetical protein